ncbi:lasso peptide biosynthesis B2 protein [Pseudaeromonas sp. ZJS20]|uniref:lasso peptide biosynthesis B2 protein n=1 Tax=Pseudaeromonas aegiceratis TaxID=3153928 RepID=UPI00390CD026
MSQSARSFWRFLWLTGRRREALRLIGLLARARWQLRHQPIKQVLARLPRDYALNAETTQRAQRLAGQRLARLARLVPWRALCLEQAIALSLWSARQGLPYELVVGVGRDEQNDFAAHAWIEVDTQVVLGGPVTRYRVVSRHPSHKAGAGASAD